jgi:hypothetical protein
MIAIGLLPVRRIVPCLLVSLLVCMSQFNFAQAAPKPNIVIFITDDLDRATLAVRPAIMPNLLRLIGEAGATFTKHSSMSRCAGLREPPS